MENIKNKLTQLTGIEGVIADDVLRLSISHDKWRSVAEYLRNEAHFDYLFDIVGMDLGESLGATFYVSNTENPKFMVAVTVAADGGRENPIMPSVRDLWKSAELAEREVFDYFGVYFEGHGDMRRLFLRADWKGFPLRKDYDANPELNPIPLVNQTGEQMEELPEITLQHGVEQKRVFEKGEYVVNFGPQHPAMHGVLHLRVALDGEEIKKVDPIFGYIHRGIEKMSEKYTYPQILHLTERLDYLSGSIPRHAVCLCCEKALEMNVPERAVVVRTIFDELSRIASHLLGWGAMAMDMGAITAFIYGMRDREKVLDIFEETTGGRMMTSFATIGGLVQDIHPNFQKRVKEFIVYMRKMLKEHHILFTGNPIARGRMEGIGKLAKDLAIAIGATGPSSRASGWHNDLRKIAPYAAYDKVNFEEVLRKDGLTFDRYIIRLDEIEQSLRIIEQLIDNIPEGPFAEKTKAVIRLPEGEFMQRVETARGQFGVHISSRGDKSPYRIKFRSPCMTLVKALVEIASGDKISDLIMLGASFDYVIPCIDR